MCVLAEFKVCMCCVCNGLDRANMPEQKQLRILSTHQCIQKTTHGIPVLKNVRGHAELRRYSMAVLASQSDTLTGWSAKTLVFPRV